jgi:hypothetical protein
LPDRIYLKTPQKSLFNNNYVSVISIILVAISLVLLVALGNTIFSSVIYDIMPVITSFIILLITSFLNFRQTRINRIQGNIEIIRKDFIESVKKYLREVDPEYIISRLPIFSEKENEKNIYTKLLYQRTTELIINLDVYYDDKNDVIEKMTSVYQYINRILDSNADSIENTSVYTSYCNYYQAIYDKLLKFIEKEPKLY